MSTSRPLVLAGLGGAGLLLLAACGAGGATSSGSSSGGGRGYGMAGSPTHASPHPASSGGHPASVAVRTTGLGKILVDPQQRTLYAFAADTRGHSSCAGSCLNYWPPVPSADAPKSAPAGVTAKFGTTTATNGTSQLTVNGYPMYTYVGDSAPGQTTGQGTNLSGGLWWVVSPTGAWDKRTG